MGQKTKKKQETVQQKKVQFSYPFGVSSLFSPFPRLNGLGYHSRVVSSDRDHECIAIFLFMSSGSLLNRWSANLTRVNVCFCQGVFRKGDAQLLFVFTTLPLVVYRANSFFWFCSATVRSSIESENGNQRKFLPVLFPCVSFPRRKEKLREKEIQRL